jgi:ABC-2 type transport system permease protein
VSQLATRIREQRAAGTFELLVAEPVNAATIAIGTAAYPFLFTVVRAGAYLAVAAGLLGLRVTGADWLGVTVLLVVGGLATMAIGVGLAAVAVVWGHGDSAARVLVVALSFLSGTYFPVATLPAPLRLLSAPLPTRLAVDGLRSALAGGPWLGHAAVLVGSAAVGLPVAVGVFSAALRLAVRRGTLTDG